MGLGQRNVEDDRHLLVQDTQLMARVRRRIERGDAYTGLSRPITGRPNAVWREWERSGALGGILAWLRDGRHQFTFTSEVQPHGLGGPNGEATGTACMIRSMRRGYIAQSKSWCIWAW